MNLNLFLEGLIEIILSFGTGLFVFFMAFKVFSMSTKDIDEMKELKENNIAVSILGVSFVFGIMLIVKAAINPAMDTLTVIMNAEKFVMSSVIFAIVRILIFYIVAAIFAFLILWLAIKLFMILTTDIDEMEEIKNKNVSVAIVIGTLVISMSLILLSPLKTLLNGLVAAPVVADSGIQEHLINMAVFLQGLIELGLSIIGALFVFFFSFKVYQLLTKNIDEIAEMKKNNIAVGVLNASFVFSIMIVVKAALVPANEALGFALSAENIGIGVILFVILRIVLFFLGSALIAFLVIWISMKFFMMLTKNIDEMKEIKNNNIAVAILIAILVISAALLLEHGVTILLQGLIKTPELGKGLLDASNIK